MRSFPGMRQIPFEDRGKFNVTFFLEHLFPQSQLLKRERAATQRRIIEHVQRGGKGRILDVERVAHISPKDFQQRHLASGVPLLIERGAVDWPLLRSWSFESFRKRYGHETIKLVQRKGLSDDDFFDEQEFSEEIGFADFLAQVQSGGTKYMRFSPLLEKFPELLDDFDHEFFKTMVGNKWGTTFALFMGGKGTFTPLHNATPAFFFVNVCGVKRWALIPNHYLALLDPGADGRGYNHSEAEVDLSNVDRFPGFDCIDRMEVVMHPGDILYVPSWMWHCVQNEASTIGVRCGFVYPRGMLSESFTLTSIRLFAARNPSLPVALYYSLFKRNLHARDKWLLTSTLIRR